MFETTIIPGFPSRRLLRFGAVVTLVLLFALLALGAIVTSFRVGMADPIWPTRPWHLFTESWQEPRPGYYIEHTHRLAGFITGGAVALLTLLIWLTEPRPALRWIGLACIVGLLAAFGQMHGSLLGHQKLLKETGELTTPNWAIAAGPTLAMLSMTIIVAAWSGGIRFVSVLLLFAVMGQGILGGLRVYLNALNGSDLAAIHGVCSQIVLALAVTVVILTGPPRLLPPVIDRTLIVAAASAALIVFGQIVAGAVLRHSDSPFGPRLHLLGAFLVMFATAAVSRQSRGAPRTVRVLAVLAASLAGLQILLGMEAWMIRFRSGFVLSAMQQVTRPDAIVRTLHALVGYGLFAAVVALAVVLLRSHEPPPRKRTLNRSVVHAEAVT